MRARVEDRWTHERVLWAEGRCVAGLDEVGTGAWAGPVVGGCVVFDPDAGKGHPEWALIDDSKRLSARRRQALDAWIREHARAVGLGWVAASELSGLGMTRASLLVMERALAEVEAQLAGRESAKAAAGEGPVRKVEHLLVDARVLPAWRGPQTALVGGDGRSGSIGAASIVAKVARDQFMVEAAARFPGYGFEVHKGYGTAAHRAALDERGPCELHRPTFLPATGQLALWD